MDLLQITAICQDNRNMITYLRDQNMLKRTFTCCQRDCNEVKARSSDGTEFRCNICDKRYSIRSNSFFFNIHICIKYILLLLFLFSTKTPVMQCVKYLGKKVDRKTISLVFAKFRDIMTESLLRNPILLGGPNVVVEIDETCLGRKHKYQRGYFRGSGQKWVIGLLDRNTKKVHIQWVPNRTRPILFDIIQRHVQQHSVIHSDEAMVYRTLNRVGYIHRTLCHQENYVAPDGTHTNNIENHWLHLKNFLREKHGVYTTNLAAYLDEHLYRWNRKQEGPVYELLIRDICDQYPL